MYTLCFLVLMSQVHDSFHKDGFVYNGEPDKVLCKSMESSYLDED